MSVMNMCGLKVPMPDLDDLFAYSTPRTVRVRDRRLGMTMCLLQLAVFVYVVIYQVIVGQSYKEVGLVSGTVRMQLLEPGSNSFRWPDQGAPFCNGVTTSMDTQYTFPAGGGVYTYGTGPRNGTGPQGQCIYYDARMAVPDPLEGGAIFLPTRITTQQQVAQPEAECTQLQTRNCTWTNVASNLSYIPDVEFFTLLLDHSFTSTVGIAYNSAGLSGQLLGHDRKPVDVCSPYYNRQRFPPSGTWCPTSVVAVGVPGRRDILPIAALLQAAGLTSLDSPFDPADPSQFTLRHTRLVIQVTIVYTNYYLPGTNDLGTQSLSDSVVKYYYTVNVLPDTEFKAEQVVTANNALPSNSRTVYNRHGIRIVVSQSGRIGVFALQTLLVNLTVSLGLLSVAALATDFFMTRCCPLRDIYRQYKERVTIDFSDLHTDKALMEKFREHPYLVDPIPPIILSSMMRDHQTNAMRKQNMDLPSNRAFDVNKHPLMGGGGAGAGMGSAVGGSYGLTSAIAMAPSPPPPPTVLPGAATLAATSTTSAGPPTVNGGGMPSPLPSPSATPAPAGMAGAGTHVVNPLHGTPATSRPLPLGIASPPTAVTGGDGRPPPPATTPGAPHEWH